MTLEQSVPEAANDEASLTQLRARFDGHWRIWRAKRGDDSPPRLWCATRLDPDAGADPTVIEDSAERLAAALREQAVHPRPDVDPLDLL